MLTKQRPNNGQPTNGLITKLKRRRQCGKCSCNAARWVSMWATLTKSYTRNSSGNNRKWSCSKNGFQVKFAHAKWVRQCKSGTTNSLQQRPCCMCCMQQQQHQQQQRRQQHQPQQQHLHASNTTPTAALKELRAESHNKTGQWIWSSAYNQTTDNDVGDGPMLLLLLFVLLPCCCWCVVAAAVGV